ncbi:hypothetical protein ACERII_09185 [Evansella sp. AB-rgal1]|uniref:hypothetical protein n=1 Tax=Evansella sp. AB-rgal1 TaxID=3242696 RepID=UPI00359CF5C7
MNFKLWGAYLFVLNVAGFIGYLYANIALYENVLSNGFFIGLFISQLVMLYQIVVKENKKAITANSGTFIVALIIYVFSAPSFTYEEGKSIVLEHYENEEIEFIETEYKNMYSDGGIFLDKNYSYRVSLNGEQMGISLHPKSGEVIEFEVWY